MLMQLTMLASKGEEMPVVSDNPLAEIDAEKEFLMKDFKKTLQTE